MGRLEYKDMGYIAEYRPAVRIQYGGELISATDYNGNIIDVLQYDVNHHKVYTAYVNRLPVDYDTNYNRPAIVKCAGGYTTIPYQFATMQEAIDAAETVSRRIGKKR